MKRLSLLTVAMSLAWLTSACGDRAVGIDQRRDLVTADSALAPFHGANATNKIRGRYIIRFKDGGGQGLDELARRTVDGVANAKILSLSSGMKALIADLPETSIDGIRRLPFVAYVEQDTYLRSDVDSQVINANGLWGLDRIDQATGTDLRYYYHASGSGVNIWIVDSGVQAVAELSGRIGSSYPHGYGNATSPCYFHGTSVAVVAAGTTHGAAKSATVHSARVDTGACDNTIDAGLAANALVWIADSAAKPAVANVSFSGPVGACQDCDYLETGVNYALAHGVTVVLAAGNASADACNYKPARVSGAITVGATNSSDQAWSSSNYGSCLDIWAPGAAIETDTLGGSTRVYSGTSLAAPFVSGAIAIFLEQNPQATVSQVVDAVWRGASKNVLSNIGTGSPNVMLWSDLPGPPDASIVGPTTVASQGYCTWTAQVYGGTSLTSEVWSGVLSSSGTGVLNGSVTQSGWLYLDVTDSRGRTSHAQSYITVDESSTSCPL